MPLDGSNALQSRDDYQPLCDYEAQETALAASLTAMRSRTFAHFAAELAAAMPDPAPRWAQTLLMRWGAESLKC